MCEFPLEQGSFSSLLLLLLTHTMQRIRTHGKFQGEKCDLSPAIILGKADVLSSFRLCLLGCLSADMGVSIFKCQTSVGGVCGGSEQDSRGHVYDTN